MTTTHAKAGAPGRSSAERPGPAPAARSVGIDLNLLPVLGALLEERSVTGAGKRVGLSQSAASKALGRLRRHFSDQLLVRSAGGYELTPEAERLLPAVREALRHCEPTLAATIAFDPARSTREFQIAVWDESSPPLVSLVRRAHERAPRVRLALCQLGGPAGQSASGHDVVIAPLGAGGLAGEQEVIYRDRFVCVARPADPRPYDVPLTLQDLADLPHAVRAPRAGHDPVRVALDAAGITPRATVTADTWLQTLFAVAAGMSMVAIVPEMLARRFAPAAGVTLVEPPFHVPLTEAAWWHPGYSADPALTWLRSLFIQQSQDRCRHE
jgi:DNA-binding transcriptional LysR family regulator